MVTTQPNLIGRRVRIPPTINRDHTLDGVVIGYHWTRAGRSPKRTSPWLCVKCDDGIERTVRYFNCTLLEGEDQ